AVPRVVDQEQQAAVRRHRLSLVRPAPRDGVRNTAAARIEEPESRAIAAAEVVEGDPVAVRGHGADERTAGNPPRADDASGPRVVTVEDGLTAAIAPRDERLAVAGEPPLRQREAARSRAGRVADERSLHPERPQ